MRRRSTVEIVDGRALPTALESHMHRRHSVDSENSSKVYAIIDVMGKLVALGVAPANIASRHKI
jgi:hypothetical protein